MILDEFTFTNVFLSIEVPYISLLCLFVHIILFMKKIIVFSTDLNSLRGGGGCIGIEALL